MIADYHIHTPLCKHAGGTPQEYIARAQALNLSEICFTDHAPAPDGYDPTNRMEIDQWPQYGAICESIRAEAKIPVLFGIEADHYRGNDGFLAEWLPKQPFDYILGSVHYVATWGIDNPEEISKWKSANIEEAWHSYFTLVGELADTGLYDAIAHFDLPKKFAFRPPDALIPEIVGPALDKLAQAGMAMEINTSGLRRPVHELYPSPAILAMARERNIPVLFGSDAHRPQDVGADFVRAIKLALNAGYTEYLTYRQREKVPVPIPVPKK